MNIWKVPLPLQTRLLRFFGWNFCSRKTYNWIKIWFLYSNKEQFQKVGQLSQKLKLFPGEVKNPEMRRCLELLYRSSRSSSRRSSSENIAKYAPATVGAGSTSQLFQEEVSLRKRNFLRLPETFFTQPIQKSTLRGNRLCCWTILL